MKVELALTVRLTRSPEQSPAEFALAFKQFRLDIESQLAAGRNLELPPTVKLRWLLVPAFSEEVNHVEDATDVCVEPAGTASGTGREAMEHVGQPLPVDCTRGSGPVSPVDPCC